MFFLIYKLYYERTSLAYAVQLKKKAAFLLQKTEYEKRVNKPMCGIKRLTFVIYFLTLCIGVNSVYSYPYALQPFSLLNVVSDSSQMLQQEVADEMMVVEFEQKKEEEESFPWELQKEKRRKEVLYLVASFFFWVGGSWLSLQLVGIRNFWCWLWTKYYTIKKYSQEAIDKAFRESNYRIIKKIGWPVFRFTEWFFETQRTIEVPIEKEEIWQKDEEKFLKEVAPSRGSFEEESTNVLEKLLDVTFRNEIDLGRIKKVFEQLKEPWAVWYLEEMMTIKPVLLEIDEDAPFVYVLPNVRNMEYCYSYAEYKEENEEQQLLIYINVNLINRWLFSKSGFRTQDAMHALIAETILYHVYRRKYKESSYRGQMKKQIKYAQLMLSGLGEMNNKDVLDIAPYYSKDRVKYEHLMIDEIHYLESLFSHPDELLHVGSGLDDCKKWEAYRYWHSHASSLLGHRSIGQKGIEYPKNRREALLYKVQNNIDTLARRFPNIYNFMDAVIMSYFLMHPHKISFPSKCIQRLLDKFILYIGIPKEYFFNYLNRSVHSGFFNKFDAYQKYNYFWLLQAGFSGLMISRLISCANRSVDDLKLGFIPGFGDHQSRHFNTYIHDGREGVDHKSYYGPENIDAYVENYIEDPQVTLLLKDTRKDWAQHEFIKAIVHYRNKNLYKSIQALGRGAHSLQDIPAHLDFNTGKYGTRIHPDGYDDPSMDIIGVDEEGNIVFAEGTQRIRMTEKISVLYYQAYLAVIEFIDGYQLQDIDEMMLQTKIQIELKKVWEVVEPLIVVSQVLPHLSLEITEQNQKDIPSLTKEELSVMKEMVGNARILSNIPILKERKIQLCA